MVIKANVVMLSGTQLRGTARSHTIMTDRPLHEGGSDAGCTSGEMLLLAIGSCASGTLRRHFAQQGTPCETLSADVWFDTPAAPGKRDRIVISLTLDSGLSAMPDDIRTLALSGGVTSRIASGSDIEVRVNGT